jgi:predicted nucleic acid-binding protein
MKRRLSAAQSNNDFAQLGITVEDLRAITTLEARKKLGKGELSSIVFAKKASQAFMTDDKKARVLSGEEIGISLTQTTPHLVGWLVFTYKLNDSEIALIKNQHREMKRPLSNHFDTVHLRGLHFRISVGNPT